MFAISDFEEFDNSRRLSTSSTTQPPVSSVRSLHRSTAGWFFAVALALGATAFPAAASAVGAPNFSGRWTFDAGQSRNIGMMVQAEINTTIEQTLTSLTIDDHSSFGGKDIDDHIVYDLTGRPSKNATKMSGSGTTDSRWDGSRLVTDWDDSVAPQKSRVEIRYLSDGGKTMFVESHSLNKDPILMAFDRAQ